MIKSESNIIKNYYTNGKLLLTGEYLVLKGAKALAIPLNVGQSLSISSEDGSSQIKWISNEKGTAWFETKIEKPSFELLSSTNEEIALKLISVLKEAKKLNPSFLDFQNTIICETDLGFNRNWGFGSSSTLISLISKWANVNPYTLLGNTFGGSGYDIACSVSNKPLLYYLEKQEPIVNELDFNPAFSDKLYFVYLGEKQRSDLEVNRFKKQTKTSDEDIDYASFLTEQFISAKSQLVLNELIIEHETFIGEIIQRKPVKQELFPDFNGSIKSLGAWGGDFVLVSSLMSEEDTFAYFKNKQLETIFKYDDIVLK